MAKTKTNPCLDGDALMAIHEAGWLYAKTGDRNDMRRGKKLIARFCRACPDPVMCAEAHAEFTLGAQDATAAGYRATRRITRVPRRK